MWWGIKIPDETRLRSKLQQRGFETGWPRPSESTLSVKTGLRIGFCDLNLESYNRLLKVRLLHRYSKLDLCHFNSKNQTRFLYIVNLSSTYGYAFIPWVRDIEFVLSRNNKSIEQWQRFWKAFKGTLLFPACLKAIWPVQWTIKCQLWASTILPHLILPQEDLMPQKLRTIVGGKLELITNNIMWILSRNVYFHICQDLC